MQRKDFWVFNPGNWFMTPKSFVLAADGDGTLAITLCAFLELTEIGSDGDDWFPMSGDELKIITGKTESSQLRLLTKMKEMNLIETRTQNNFPRMRYIRIKTKGLHDFMHEGSEKVKTLREQIQKKNGKWKQYSNDETPAISQVSPNRLPSESKGRLPSESKGYDNLSESKGYDNLSESKGYYAFKKKKEKSKNSERTLFNVSVDGESTNAINKNNTNAINKNNNAISFDLKAAKFLFKLLVKNHQIRNTRDIQKWKKEFTKLRTLDEIPKKRIIKVLKWFKQNSIDKFAPKARSATAFRQKFDSIASQMERATTNGNGNENYYDNKKGDLVTHRHYTPEENKKWAEENLPAMQ